MRKTAAFLLAIFLVFALSLTTFADFGPERPQQPGPQGGNLDGDGVNDDGGDDGADEPTDPVEETASAETAAADETTAAENASQSTDSAGVQETQSATDAAQEGSIAQQDGTNFLSAKDAKAAEEASDGSANNGVIIAVIVCGSILLILLIVIAVLLLRKKQPHDDEDPDDGQGRGMPVHIEVLSGLCYNANLDFRLRRNLTIGTDKGCDIVFEDKLMHPMHAVISADEKGVKLEEASAAGVTYIGGMKIFSPNRLRSGDVVTIGATSFCITFEEA